MHKLLKQAFTLIELLVVIAIIGILSGLIIVGMSGMTQKATIAKAQVFSNSLRNSLLMSIVGEWKLDEGSGTAANDTWTKTNNGTLYNFADTTAGYGDTHASGWMSGSNCISGPCLKFDGVDDYILLQNVNNLIAGSGYNISFWMNAYVFGYPSSACGNKNAFLIQWGYIGSSSGGFSLSLDSPSGSSGNLSMNGQLPYGDTNRWNTYSNAITKLNSWNFISINYDPVTKKIHYFINANGPYAGNHSVLGNDPDYYPLDVSSSPLLFLGGNNTNKGCGSGYLTGLIDDIHIYNAAMPTSQIKEQYYAGLNSLLAKGEITKQDYQNRMGELAVTKP